MGKMHLSQQVCFNKILRSFLVLSVAGAGIGLLHPQDTYVAVILGVIGVVTVWGMWRQRSLSGRIVLCAGITATGLLGVRAEIWGVQNGYWVYHDLLGGRQFPFWLPMAWSLAFVFLYRVELRFIELLQLSQLKEKMLLAAVVSILLPTWGEIVTINLGVWTYTWGLQFFGVPILAIFLLMTLHMGVYLSLVLVCRLLAIEDVVFGCR